MECFHLEINSSVVNEAFIALTKLLFQIKNFLSRKKEIEGKVSTKGLGRGGGFTYNMQMYELQRYSCH